MRRTLRVVFVLVATLAVGAGTLGVAEAHRGPHPFHRPIHFDATFSYLDGSTRALIGDRGSITAVSGTSLTLVRPDGVEVTVAIDDGTCIREGSWELLEVGERAAVVSEMSSIGTQHALVIRTGWDRWHPDEPACGLLAGAYHADGVALFSGGGTVAFAWDRGHVSGLAPRRIRIHRLDGTPVTAAVDRWTHVFPGSYRSLHLREPVWMLSVPIDEDPGLLARFIHRIRHHH
jgi:hypothetical protein